MLEGAPPVKVGNLRRAARLTPRFFRSYYQHATSTSTNSHTRRKGSRMNFSTFATSLFQSQANQPLFFSTATSHPREPGGPRGPSAVEEDILGESFDDDEDRAGGRPQDDEHSNRALDASSRHGRADQRGALGLSSVVPAFVTRLGAGAAAGGGRAGPVTHGTRSGAATRGWKAYESLAATRQFPRHDGLTDSDLSEEEDDDDHEGPLPGTFVSKLSPPGHSPELYPMNEPLMGRRTLFVYPAASTTSTRSVSGGGVNSPSRELYRDSVWIAAYGLCLAATMLLAIKAYMSIPSSPPAPRPPVEPDYPSLLSTTPVFLVLSLLSLLTSTLALALLLVLRRTLRPILGISILVGPFFFCLIGFIAFGASFGQNGVERDRGWKTGMRVFACGCVAMSWLLGRASIKRRQELNRAIMVGEVRPGTSYSLNQSC